MRFKSNIPFRWSFLAFIFLTFWWLMVMLFRSGPWVPFTFRLSIPHDIWHERLGNTKFYFSLLYIIAFWPQYQFGNQQTFLLQNKTVFNYLRTLKKRHCPHLPTTCRCGTNTPPFNGPFTGTTQVSRYQKGKTSLDFTEARDSKWQWHQLGHMHVCTSHQTDNHTSTPPLIFYRPDALPATQPTASKHCRHIIQTTTTTTTTTV